MFSWALELWFMVKILKCQNRCFGTKIGESMYFMSWIIWKYKKNNRPIRKNGNRKRAIFACFWEHVTRSISHFVFLKGHRWSQQPGSRSLCQRHLLQQHGGGTWAALFWGGIPYARLLHGYWLQRPSLDPLSVAFLFVRDRGLSNRLVWGPLCQRRVSDCTACTSLMLLHRNVL